MKKENSCEIKLADGSIITLYLREDNCLGMIMDGRDFTDEIRGVVAKHKAQHIKKEIRRNENGGNKKDRAPFK